MAIKRLVLIRPGETDWNLTGRWQGWAASPLNDLGRQQMARLAMFIRNIGLTVLYSSDSRRAKESAKIIAESIRLDPIYDERLRERSIGFFQGLTVPEIHGWYPDEHQALLSDPEGYRIPGGESLNDVAKRVSQALEEIIQTAEDNDELQTVGIITHTSIIRRSIKKLLPDFNLTNADFDNSSVTTLAYEDGDWQMNAVNDLMHLEGLESRHMPADPRGDDAQ